MKKYPPKTTLVVGCVSVGAAALLIASYLLGYSVAQNHYRALFGDFSAIRQSNSRYPLISPLLAYRAPEATELGKYTDLKSVFENIVQQATSTGVATNISIYFRDLDASEWVGVNQNSTYYPASLLKVPVMIAYFKKAESDPSVLTEYITYQAVKGEAFDTPSTLVPGKSYTVEQLIESMIIESDNGAAQTLLAHIDSTVLDQVYTDLGITNPGDDSATYELSARSYGLFFRVLYNATYLNLAYSEKALVLLSRATFAQGLTAGIPDGVVVAHKFGEHIMVKGNTPSGVELHDCGIVYYPGRPYLLCVMTNAKDVASAYSIIKNISAKTYSAIQKQRPFQ